jgi:hypothetical protein
MRSCRRPLLNFVRSLTREPRRGGIINGDNKKSSFNYYILLTIIFFAAIKKLHVTVGSNSSPLGRLRGAAKIFYYDTF